MSVEAIARLREWDLGDNKDNADLRALLDAHAALKAAHTEALDALEKSNQYIDDAVKRQHGRYDDAVKQHGRRDPRTEIESRRLHDLINSTRGAFDSVAFFLAKAGRRFQQVDLPAPPEKPRRY